MSLYKQPGSEVWWINLSHNGERVRRSSGETDRTEAQRRHDELKVELWKAQPKVRGRTWGMAVVHWTGLQPRSDSELLSLAKFGKLFPDRRLVDVTREDIDKVLSSFCKTAGTYTRYRTMITAILNAAKAEGVDARSAQARHSQGQEGQDPRVDHPRAVGQALGRAAGAHEAYGDVRHRDRAAPSQRAGPDLEPRRPGAQSGLGRGRRHEG